MRVIAGEFRSRVLKTLPGLDTRPTPDRLREALFSILQAVIRGSTFMDAYAGTGAVGIEALSRGASRAIFIERSRGAANVIRENLQALSVYSRAELIQGRTLQYLKQRTADIVFLDPPYERAAEYSDALTILGEMATSLVIAQHESRKELALTYGHLQRTRVLKQGDNTLSFYKPATSE